MSTKQLRRLLLPLLVLGLLLTLSTGALAQVGKGWFWVDYLRVDNNANIDGALKVAGAATIGTNLAVGDNATVGNILYLTPGTAISLTNGAIITPTASYQPIDAAPGTTVTPTLAAGSAGQLLRLVNQGTGTILLIDTGTAKLSGDISLGQYDGLLLMSDGTNWVMLGTSNN